MRIENGMIVTHKRDLSRATYDESRLLQRVKELRYFTDEELFNVPAGTFFTFDIETYPNWFFIAFREIGGLGRVVTFESSEDMTYDISKLAWLVYRIGMISYNGNGFDKYLLVLALRTTNYVELKEMADDIIVNQLWGYNIEKKYGLNMPKFNHIDLMEVAPLSASLKAYMGRLHCDVIQDLPFKPQLPLSPIQRHIGRMYCGNDLEGTESMFHNLAEQLRLRAEMSVEYGVDLRSKSDAQIAEAVICKEMERLTGVYPVRQKLDPGYSFQYQVPDYIQFTTPLLQQHLERVRQATFYLYENGAPACPEELNVLLPIGSSVYQFGIGGLHSTESSVGIVCAEDEQLEDDDVESFYPRMILNQRLFPAHLGEGFLEVYDQIVTRRVTAKRAKNKAVADSLKIVINGSFGKFGDRWSALYSPDFLVQVTISGQLSLLMLIEALENIGIKVVSANTDGIVMHYKTERRPEVKALIKAWEKHCGFVTEETQYMGLFSRDVSNYIAVKRKQNKETKEWLYETDGCKLKGVFGNPWDDKDGQIFRFHKNPNATICSIAVQDYIVKGIPLAKTVFECHDITKFVTVANARGGAVYCGTNHYLANDGDFVGKVVRWYKAKGVDSSINMAGSGNKVATSSNAVPLMDFSVGFPPDLDHAWYIQNAEEMLYDIGYKKRITTLALF